MENDLEAFEKIELCPIFHKTKNKTRFGHIRGYSVGAKIGLNVP